MNSLVASAVASLSAAVLFTACSSDANSDRQVVRLYVALDREHSKALVDRFNEQSKDVIVDPNFDVEANKTVGLMTAILEERENPRCDVFWNNELAHTVSLAQQGLTVPYVSANAAGIPEQFKDKDGHWTGFASRARVIIVNTELIPNEADRPTSIWDFTDPKWKGKCAIARPLTGTTLTHFTALRYALGDRYEEWLDGLKKNEVVFMQSNGATMKTTSDKTHGIAFALTDTDDYHVALTKGHPVTCVFPDQGDDQIGTMLIPNSVCMIKGGPAGDAAKALIDFIVSEEVEGLLAAAKSAQIPVRSTVKGPPEKTILGIGNFKSMNWNAQQVGAGLADALKMFQQRYGQ